MVNNVVLNPHVEVGYTDELTPKQLAGLQEFMSNRHPDGSHIRHSNPKLHGFKAFENKIMGKVEEIEKECPVCLPIVVAVVAGVIVYQLFLKQPYQGDGRY